MKKKLVYLAFAMLLYSNGDTQITSPESFLGFQPGDDYKLAGWEQITAYYRMLGSESGYVRIVELGRTTQDRPLIMAIISHPDNLNNLTEIQETARKLSDARGLSGQTAEALAESGRIIVLITCSMHASEVGATQASLQLVYDLLTDDDPRNRNILDQVVFLLIPSFNPDGLEMIRAWYNMYLETAYEGSSLPWLYHLYTGHDNNRDAFMLTQKESRLVNQVLYQTWFPQVYLDMHQMGNRGARIFVPPFIDPLNPNTDPLIVWEIGMFGKHMALDLEAAGKKGIGTAHLFSGWWEGSFLMNAWWHNTVGLLTEVASCRIATPVFQEKKELTAGGRHFTQYVKTTNFPNPWPGGWWRLSDIVEYDIIAAKSLLETAALHRKKLLYHRYLMGKRALELGETEPPFAWLIPPDQKDPAAAGYLLRLLLEGGVEIHRALEDFRADNIPFPEGTHVILMTQAFRAYAKDLLEEQRYPDLRETEDAEPVRPYDVAGWTLPYQMNVHAVEVARPFEAAMQPISEAPPPHTVLPRSPGWGYLLSHQENQTFILTNRLLKAGKRVYWIRSRDDENPQLKAGSIVIPARQKNLAAFLKNNTADLSLSVRTLSGAPAGEHYRLRTPRLGVYQPWMPSMHEGWSRWILEQYEFEYTNIHNEEIRTGNLINRYDVIYLPDIWAEGILEGREKGTTPPVFAGGIEAGGLSNLKSFVEAGGTLITMDSSSDLLTDAFGLPVINTVREADTRTFYCPGSILAMEYDVQHPVAYGMEKQGVGFFSRSPAFRLIPNFQVEASVVAKYPERNLLKSGFLLGEETLANKASLVEIPVGGGKIIMIGFDAVNRAQAHATFKILFNAVFYGHAEPETIK